MATKTNEEMERDNHANPVTAKISFKRGGVLY